jgi:hypothetical protein
MAVAAEIAAGPRLSHDQTEATGQESVVARVGFVLATRSIIGALLLGVLVGAVSAETPEPYLRSAGAHHRHVVAVFTLGDLAPGNIVVAVKPDTNRGGAFPARNVRLTETLPAGALVIGTARRVQTRHRLKAGRYYVHVSAMVIGVDCIPKRPCATRWSNIRRVVIPRSR